MSDTIGRIIRRVPAGTAGLAVDSNLLRARRALASITGHLMTSDLNQMGDEYARRSAWTHPGFFGFWANSPGNPGVAGPNVGDIDWTGFGLDVEGRSANAFCGVVWVVGEGPTTRLPKLVLRARARAAVKTGATSGFYLGVCPGVGTFPGAQSNHAGKRFTLPAFDDLTLSISLQQSDLGALVTTPTVGATATGVPVAGDTVRLMVGSVWFGAYNSVGTHATGDETTDVTGLSLALEPG